MTIVANVDVTTMSGGMHRIRVMILFFEQVSKMSEKRGSCLDDWYSFSRYSWIVCVHLLYQCGLKLLQSYHEVIK